MQYGNRVDGKDLLSSSITVSWTMCSEPWNLMWHCLTWKNLWKGSEVWQPLSSFMFYSLEVTACLHHFGASPMDGLWDDPWTDLFHLSQVFQSVLWFLIFTFLMPCLACHWDGLEGSWVPVLPTDVSPHALIWAPQIRVHLSKCEPFCFEGTLLWATHPWMLAQLYCALLHEKGPLCLWLSWCKFKA